MSQAIGFAGIVIAASLLAEILKKGGVNGARPAVIDVWRADIPTTTTTTPATYETPTTTGWEILTGEGARDVDYVVTIDPAEYAAYLERERTLRLLRG